jgi:ATP-dependent exoDNAse (exonuclease V) alpha subunit
MSIFHLTVRSVSRVTGRSAVAAAAYRAGERLTNARDGLTHDYSGKPVLEAFILAPVLSPPWASDRSSLWNAAELAEKRKDAKVAREYELALPAELNQGERRSLAVQFAQVLIARYGVAVDVALHPPDALGDQRNFHAHLLTTTRAMGPEGLGEKTRQLDVSSAASVEVEALRASWAQLVNDQLERADLSERVDHRSFQRQGKTIEPTVKMGPVITAIERRAQSADVSGDQTQPVTSRGRLNALILEMRRLVDYVDLGREFIAQNTAKLATAALLAASKSKQLRAVMSLFRTLPAIEATVENDQAKDRERDRGLGLGR